MKGKQTRGRLKEAYSHYFNKKPKKYMFSDIFMLILQADKCQGTVFDCNEISYW